MNIKGTAYVSGKLSLIENFGQERWNSFLAGLAAKEDYYSNMIMTITLIPLEKFVVFLDEIIREFFNNDNTAYWLFGMTSAKFALSESGPYHSYLLTRDIKQFVEAVMPELWETYFDGGKLEAQLESNTIHIKITGLPMNHVYFEYLIMGYCQQALKVFGEKAEVKKIKGFSSGDQDIYYQFEIKES